MPKNQKIVASTKISVIIIRPNPDKDPKQCDYVLVHAGAGKIANLESSVLSAP